MWYVSLLSCRSEISQISKFWPLKSVHSALFYAYSCLLTGCRTNPTRMLRAHKRCPSLVTCLHVTRHAHKDVIPELLLPDSPPYDAHELSSQKGSFSVCGPDVWNSHPTALRHIDSYPAFRRALKSHLFSCDFSS